MKAKKLPPEDVDIAQLVAGWEDVTVASLLAMLGDVQIPDDPLQGVLSPDALAAMLKDIADDPLRDVDP